jgi:hypothetical protein
MNRRALVSAALAYVFPGAGHLFLGKRRRAVAFSALVVLMFVAGILIDGRLYHYGEARGQLITRLATFASMGSGSLYFLGLAFGPPGDVRSLTFEYGRTFTLTAGLMNLLLVLDCWDIAVGRKS